MTRPPSLWLTVCLAPLLSLAAGCWRDAEQINNAVWSDDDSGHAYIKLFYEESTTHNPFTGGPNTRNQRHQLWVQAADGTGRRAVTGVRDGATGSHLFYMKEAGYVLLDVVEDNSVARYDVVRLSDGHADTLARWSQTTEPASPCLTFDVLPSPDGSVIATLERTAPSNTPAGCEDGTITIKFIDAATLDTLATHAWHVRGMVDAVWTRAGDLMAWSYRDGAWRVDPATGPTPAVQPTCTNPRTSSSTLSEGGDLIAPGPSDDEPIIVVDRGGPNCW